MSADAQDHLALLQAIELLRSEVARLSDRIAALEGANHHPLVPVDSSPKTNHAYGAPVIDEALLYVISAAAAAYLGVQPRIRQIRLVGGSSWAQQGRVTIQASHALLIRHG